jgi:hypothetical protein
MKTWTPPLGHLVHARLRSPGSPVAPAWTIDEPGVAATAALDAPVADGTAAVAPSTAEVVAHPADLLAVEIAAAALLVASGRAPRVVVCNAPASIDLDEVRLLADRYDVRVEPMVRIGGGGLDLAVVPPDAPDAAPLPPHAARG